MNQLVRTESEKEDAMSEKVYTVNGIHCQSCVSNISEAVGAVEGVSGVNVDPSADKVVVTGEQFDDGKVRAAIESAGYQAA